MAVEYRRLHAWGKTGSPFVEAGFALLPEVDGKAETDAPRAACCQTEIIGSHL